MSAWRCQCVDVLMYGVHACFPRNTRGQYPGRTKSPKRITWGALPWGTGGSFPRSIPMYLHTSSTYLPIYLFLVNMDVHTTHCSQHLHTIPTYPGIYSIYSACIYSICIFSALENLQNPPYPRHSQYTLEDRSTYNTNHAPGQAKPRPFT
jgi:hypothetical protein